MNPSQHLFNSNIQPPYQTNLAYQQPQRLTYQQPPPPYQTSPRPFQPPPQQYGPRFQTPNQHHFTPENQFYHPPKQHHDHQGHPYQLTTPPPQPFYPPSTPLGFNQEPKPPYHSLGSNYEPVPPNLPYLPPSGSNFNQAPIPPPSGPNFNQVPISPSSGPNFNQAPIPPPSIPNFNQAPIPPPSGPNFNQVPIPSVYQPPGPMFQQPVQNYNQPPYAVPPQQNYNQPLTPQSPTHRFCQVPNNPYQAHGQRVDIQRYSQQQETPYNLPRQEFNQSRPPYRPPGQQFRPFRHQNTRFGLPQNNCPKPQFYPRQQHHQNYHTNDPSSFNNQQKFNSSPKKDKQQIACNKGDCDFVGHASAVREHQNMHHRFGLHKKVLYSNSSDAIKKWIEERKKKWPTKEIALLKLEIEEEKNKRGERIADEDFHRFNKKNDKFNRDGNSGRFNNRKRPKFDGTYTECPEEPMNGNLNRFSGINEIIIKEKAMKDEAQKSGSLKLLEEYECSDNASDDDAPEEVAIVKESAPLKNDCFSSTDEHDVEKYQTLMTIDDTKRNEDNNITATNTNGTQENKKEDFASVNDKPEKIVTKNNTNNNEIKENCEVENNQKRKRPQKKDGKPVKKVPPLRTPRNEVMERKAALLEALMGNLMRSERNTITQCICYIRNNMDRFTKSQTA